MASLFLETAPFEYSSSKKSNSSKYNKDEDEDEGSDEMISPIYFDRKGHM